MTVANHSSEARHSVPKWVEVTIGEISEVVAGGTPKAGEPSNFAEPGSAISWLTPADLSGYSEKYISYGRRDLSQHGYDSSSAKLMPQGSLLFSSRAPIGYVVIAKNEISTNQGFKNFIFTKNVDSSYAYYYLRSIRELAESLGTGTTFKEISGATAKKLPFVLPPLAEQKVIADKLDVLLAQVETTKARLDRIPQILKTFRQSVLAAAVCGKLTEEWRSKNRFEKTIASSNKEKFFYEDKYNFETPEIWCFTAIGNAANFQQGLQIAKSARGLKSDEGVLPILRTVNYENDFKKDVQYAFVDDKSIIAEPEDIILSRTGTVGRVLTGYKGIMHNNSFRINYDKSILIKDFLAYFLSSPICQTYVKENSGRSTQPDLTHKAFSKCPIGIPSINEQTEIVKRVEELFAFADSIEQKANAALEKVNNLTQSILAKAFRGELTADWREQNPELISGENSADALLARIKADREVLKPKKVTRKKKA